jgi:adenylylsulfate kinase
MKEENIIPQLDLFLSKQNKETLLQQKAVSLWLTGLPGSGKTTLSHHLEKRMHNAGFLVKVFDGDIVRNTIHRDLDFSNAGRMENIKRVALLNNEFINCGVIVINSFVSPSIEIRNVAKDIIGIENFYEIFVKCSLGVCESRDPKGLYAKARQGLISNFTGLSGTYENPINPAFLIDTECNGIEESVERIYNFILPKIKS